MKIQKRDDIALQDLTPFRIYSYDDPYRLTSAGGSFTQSPGKERRYTLAMQYDAVHKGLINQKFIPQ